MNPSPKLFRSPSSLSRSSSSLSTSSSLQTTRAYKISSLYEIEYFPNLDSIPVDKLPFLNSYHIHRNPLSSFARSVKTLIQPPSSKIKEYIQCSRFDSHQLTATPFEQYIQVDIPDFLISQW